MKRGAKMMAIFIGVAPELAHIRGPVQRSKH